MSTRATEPESTSKAANLRDALQQIDALGVEGAAPVNEKEVCSASLQLRTATC